MSLLRRLSPSVVSRSLSLATASVVLFSVGCAPPEGTSGSQGTGGTTNNVDAATPVDTASTGSGGSLSPSGGAPGTGGLSASGGATSTGGTSGTSGSTATGGRGGATTSTGGSASGGGGGTRTGGNGGGGAATPTGGVAAGGSTVPGGGTGFYRMEKLNRGVVAVQVTGGVYVGWRMLGFEYDPTTPANVAYNVYRAGTKLTTVSDSTNYLDADGSASATYTVRPVIGGVEGATSETATVWAQDYLRIPLQVPPAGTTPGSPQCETANEAYTYSANDASVGDVDGDGAYEIILKWDPSNAKDNSQSGCTGNVYLDAYKIDATGTRLWRIDLGRNIRAGAHYTQFMVYDYDGDGKAEMIVKTAPGTKDGTGAYLHTGPAASDDDAADYRSMNNASGRTGYVLAGPEYLTVFNGLTGAEMSTVAFDVPRGTVSSWGDDYGNRVDRFLSGVAYLDSTGLPSAVMGRGYYTRATLTAWNWRDGKLTQLWKFDSNTTPKDSAGKPFTGQGAHSLAIANVDDDPGQEILYGAAAIDNDGKGLCSTGNNHGDALHVGDLIPSRPGLEVFMCNEDGSHPAYHIRDAKTCAIIQAGPINGADTGRCVADDISASSPGAEMWASSVTGLFSATTNANVGTKPSQQNFLVWWDADETRELEDGTTISKFGGGTLLTATGCASNNGTKSTPTLLGDLTGDWREEVVWRESNSSALRLYTTTAVTKRRIYTLMHDAQYRSAISWQNTAYNQPPHPSFHIGNGMIDPPRPNIVVK